MKNPRRATTPATEESHGAAASAWCELGRDSMASGDLPDALWHLRQAVENDNDYITAWQLLGRCFEQLGEEARAQRCFRLAFRLSLKGGRISGRSTNLEAPMVVPPREPRDA